MLDRTACVLCSLERLGGAYKLHLVPGHRRSVSGCCCILEMGVSENRGPQYSTLNSRILIIRTPK